MDINSTEFLTITRPKYQAALDDENIIFDETDNISATLTTAVGASDGDTVEINGKIATIADVSFEDLENAPITEADMNIISASEPNPLDDSNTIMQMLNAIAASSTIPVAKTLKTGDITENEVYNIKKVIYNLHHNKPQVETYDPNKNTFINDKYGKFNDTTSLFKYMNSVNSNITIETGVSRAQLIEFTKNDDKEDSNSDFFGSLNRIFNKLDTNNNGYLEFDEIKKFLGDEIGDVKSFQKNVNIYCEAIQQEFDKKSPAAKLEYIIELTEQYLEATGMTDQLEVLNMLKKETDKANGTDYIAKQGQIVFADLNPDYVAGSGDGYTLGCYSYYVWKTYTYTKDGNTYAYYPYAGDADEYDPEDGWFDGGLTLGSSLLDNKNRFGETQSVFAAVNTLVHELTHATTKLYYNAKGCVNEKGAKKLLDLGAISQATYNSYINDYKSGKIKTHKDCPTEILYNMSAATGEYMAYQTDANYLDSVAGDEFDKNCDTAKSGREEEKKAIIDQIAKYYDNGEEYKEPKPFAWEWWNIA